ncbi:MAG: HupE/UreJ family protein [Methylococcaceae bacterium]|nr:HupE/UreJ family protein [Methylococcaceae bacterium]
MLKPLATTLYALCKHPRLPLVLGLLLAIGLLVFNGLAALVDANGWSSGFIHPLHGADHLLAMLAVGIWAAQLRGAAIWLLPLTFVGVMSLGGLAGAAGILLPGAEAVVLLSCLVFVGLITRKIRFSSQTNILIVAFFAFFHGYAHGQEISTSASLISYTLGFMVATLLLHGAGILVVRLCVLLVGFFISQLSFGQTTADLTPVHQAVAAKVSTDFSTTRLAKVADSQHNDSGGVQHALTNTQAQAYGLGIPAPEVLQIQPPRKWSVGLCHQPGRHFLTSGVGLASPPQAVIDNASPRYCPAALVFAPDVSDNRRVSSLESARLVTPNYRLATSLLSNGVGATSPPVAVAANPVLALEFSLPALGNPATTSPDYQRGIHALPVIASPVRSAYLPNSPNAALNRATPLSQPVFATATEPNKAYLYALLRLKDRPPKPHLFTHTAHHTYNNKTEDNNGRSPNPYTA